MRHTLTFILAVITVCGFIIPSGDGVIAAEISTSHEFAPVEWNFGSEGADFQFTNDHSHLYMTGNSSGGLTQDTQGNANQFWSEIPTNSAN